MSQHREQATSKDAPETSQHPVDALALTIRSLGKIDRIEVLVDQRRKLPYVARAEGDRFQVMIMTDNPRLARHFAYDLGKW